MPAPTRPDCGSNLWGNPANPMIRLDPDYVRATGFVAGQVAGMLIVWFSLLDGEPPLLRLRGFPLLGLMIAGVTLGSFVGWYIAHRIAKRCLD